MLSANASTMHNGAQGRCLSLVVLLSPTSLHC